MSRPSQKQIKARVDEIRTLDSAAMYVLLALADDLAEARALLARYMSPGSSIELNAETDAFLEKRTR